VVKIILESVLELIQCARSSYFDVDHDTKDLVATVFDVGAAADKAAEIKKVVIGMFLCSNAFVVDITPLIGQDSCTQG